MTILFLPLGLLLPTFSGYALVRMLEGRTPVLLRDERWVYAFAMGTLGTMYVTFLAHVYVSVPLTRLGFLSVQMMLAAVLGGLWAYGRMRGAVSTTSFALLPASHPLSPPPLWAKILIGILAAWTTLKIAAGAAMAYVSPAYFDDVLTNWNMRGKIFFFAEKIVLESEPGVIAGTASYPPAVPMMKAWLAALAGQWHEGLVTSIHILWYLAALALLYWTLRRIVPAAWSLLGVYIFSSLPLPLMHGTVAYADGFVAVHVFLGVSTLFHTYRSDNAAVRASFLRLAAVASALLVFTKNEALLLYLPPLVLFMFLVVAVLLRHGAQTPREAQRTVLAYLLPVACVLLPWLLYKWTNHLTFGNAKAITGISFGFEPLVMKAIIVNTFLEGHWNLLAPLFLGLLVTGWRTALRTPLLLPTAFFLIVYFGQYPIYFFTSLSTEALSQTGYARGLVHLMPVVVMIATVLLHDVISCRQCMNTQQSSVTNP